MCVQISIVFASYSSGCLGNVSFNVAKIYKNLGAFYCSLLQMSNILLWSTEREVQSCLEFSNNHPLQFSDKYTLVWSNSHTTKNVPIDRILYAKWWDNFCSGFYPIIDTGLKWFQWLRKSHVLGMIFFILNCRTQQPFVEHLLEIDKQIWPINN